MLIGVLLWLLGASVSHAMDVPQAQVLAKLPAVLAENNLSEADTRRMKAGRTYTIDGVPYVISRGDYIWNGIERHLAKGVVPAAPAVVQAAAPVARPSPAPVMQDTRSWTADLQQYQDESQVRMTKTLLLVIPTLVVFFIVMVILWRMISPPQRHGRRPKHEEPHEIVIRPRPDLNDFRPTRTTPPPGAVNDNPNTARAQ